MGHTDTPDFDAVARRIAELTDVRLVRQQLVLIWNGRGAVDIAAIENHLSQLMGTTAAGPYIKNLDRALRALDQSTGTNDGTST